VGLAELITVPPEVALSMISGTEYQIDRKTVREDSAQRRVLQFDGLHNFSIERMHPKLQVRPGCGEQIASWLQAAKDGCGRGQH
jgi:hypothetical protein